MLQIVVHVILINIFCVSHAEAFFSFILNIVSFEFYDPADFLVDKFKADQNDPINEHFEMTGYERSDFTLNMGLLFLVALALPLLLMAIVFSSLFCKCLPKYHGFCRRQKEKTFNNRLIMVFETSMMILITCAAVNIYQVHKMNI